MPAFLAFLFSRQTLGVLAQALYDFVASRPGQWIICIVVAWLWSGHRAEERCAAREAAARAAAQQAVAVERAREAQAVETLRAEDRKREHLAQAHADAMQAQIDALSLDLARKEKAHAPARPAQAADDCRIDAARARRVRRIDAASGNR